jgi:hypothetical protein
MRAAAAIAGIVAALLMQTEAKVSIEPGIRVVIEAESKLEGCLEIKVYRESRRLCVEQPPYMYSQATCREYWPCPPPTGGPLPLVLGCVGKRGPIVEEPTFQQCMHGPGVQVTEVCLRFDIPPIPEVTGDGDVDLQDWAEWWGHQS